MLKATTRRMNFGYAYLKIQKTSSLHRYSPRIATITLLRGALTSEHSKLYWNRHIDMLANIYCISADHRRLLCTLSDGMTVKLGRAPHADIILRHLTSLSKLHCEITFKKNTCVLTDLTSTNGTYYLQESIKSCDIPSGSYFSAGEAIFRVILTPPQNQLLQQLFVPGDDIVGILYAQPTPLFAIFDAAQHPDIWESLSKLSPLQRQSLITGVAAKRYSRHMPYLVPLTPQSTETLRLIERGWNKGWYILFTSSSTIEALLSFFVDLTTIKDQNSGQQLLFRFYDPRVLRDFLTTCDTGQLTEIFSHIESFFCDSADGAKLVQTSYHPNSLRTQPYPCTLPIATQQPSL